MLHLGLLTGGETLMNNEKITIRMGSTTVTHTAEGFELKNGPDIKIPPEVKFKDVKNETVLGDPNNMHITTGHFNLADLKKRSETHE